MTPVKRKISLRLIEEKLQLLPLLPAAVYELMMMDEETPDFYDKATELAMSDPGLAIRVLQTVNSAATAPVAPITDLHQALVHIGINKTLKFVYLLSVARVFTPQTPTQKAIWQHSIETAHFAEFVATYMPETKVSSDLAYSCGLLHDMGRLVLFEIAAKTVDAIDTKGWDTPIELPEMENELLGFNHASVGYVAAKKWGLPKTLTDVIHYHHHYDLWSNPKVPEEFIRLITIIQFADFLSVLVEKHPHWQEWSKEYLEHKIISFCIHEDWPKLNFPIEEIMQALPEITEKCQQAMHTLHLSN